MDDSDKYDVTIEYEELNEENQLQTIERTKGLYLICTLIGIPLCYFFLVFVILLK